MDNQRVQSSGNKIEVLVTDERGEKKKRETGAHTCHTHSGVVGGGWGVAALEEEEEEEGEEEVVVCAVLFVCFMFCFIFACYFGHVLL